METPQGEDKEQVHIWEDVYIASEDNNTNPEDECMTTFFQPGTSDRAYQYVPGKGISRYYPALKNLVPVRKKSKNEKNLGVDESGLWAFLTYNWLTKYMVKAYKKGLTVEDIPNPSPQDTCDYNVQRLETLWQDELIKEGPQSASLNYVTWRFIKTRVIVSSIIMCICIILGFVSVAYFMRYLLEYAESNEAPYLTGLKWALLLSFTELLRVILYAVVWTSNYRTAIRLRTAFLGMLYRKILRVHSLGDKSIGELINLFSNDGQRVYDVVIFGPMIIGGPISMILGIFYVLWILGPWPVLGLSSMFIFYPLQYLLTRLAGYFKRKVFIITDSRLNVISEILTSIKFIKLYAWAKIYIKKISEIRRKEVSLLQKVSYCQSFSSSLSTSAPVIAGILTFLIHILVEKNITASQAFTVITLYFKLLRNVMHFIRDGLRSLVDFKYSTQRFKAFPVLSFLFITMRLYVNFLQYGLTNMFEFAITCKRFKSVMLLKESTVHLSRPVDKSQSVCIADGCFARYLNIDQNKIYKMRKRKSVSLRRNTATPEEIEKDLLDPAVPSNYFEILFDINFFAPRGSLIGICGPVGCGKTSLLSGILGHLCMTKGKLCREGTCAYVSQQAWLLNATVRENILFGEKFISKRYYNAIFSCGLGKDIDSLPGGDNTEVGERGINLSGGQKQRIALARALYSDRDIYLLDDPLSAVDSEVAKHIFEECILKALNSKTVLIVSHQIQFLNQCDEVVVMKDGRIVERGTPNELLMRDSEYRIMIDFFATRTAEQDFQGSGLEVPNEFSQMNGSVLSSSPIKDVDKSKSGAGATLIKEEKLVHGSVTSSTFLSYVNACGGFIVFICLTLVMLLNVGISSFSSWWLHMWIKAGSGNTTVILDDNSTVISNNIVDNPDYSFYQTVYCCTVGAIFVSNLLRGIVITKVTLKASSAIHQRLVNKLMKAYMLFFETTPIGRIQNLFSKDIDEVETRLPLTLESLLHGLWNISFSVLFICLAFPLFIIPLLIICVIYYFVNRTFRAGLRELKRLDNMTRSPILSNVSTTVQGLDSIHAFGKEKGFVYRFNSSFDLNTTCLYLCSIANRWLALRVDAIAILIMLITSLLIIVMHGTVPPSLAGLAIAYATTLCGVFQYTVRLVTDNEVKFISLERINSYLQYMEEEGGHGPKGVPKDTWPELGSIRFKNVELKYREELEPALKGISFHIRSEEKIGIVGRTGSGKSSIVSALFRLVELSKGCITIDNLDISGLELTELRSRLSIIPQDPVLFSGTIRTNLDPDNGYTDEEIWAALENTNLKSYISLSEDKLHTKVAYNGDNLSTGQKQLLCLARALLKKSKILILDEATSGLDYESEIVIQNTIFKNMKYCTVIIIAHRLETIQACQRILVMEDGKIAEFDEPSSLLQNSNSIFSRMMNANQNEAFFR